MKRTRTLALVGTGAYVTRDAHGEGVIARSLAQWCSRDEGPFDWNLLVVHRSASGRERFEREWKSIREEINGAPSVEFVSAGTDGAIQAIANAHALFICVPDEVHAEYLELGIAAGVPTWIVKPLTGEYTTAHDLAESARRAAVPVWVDYHKRFDVSNRMLRSTIETGTHGRPRLYSVRYSQPRDLPLEGFDWASGTDVFTYIGCHYVDQLFYLMPDLAIEGVSARGVGGPVHEHHGGIAYDTVLARIDARFRGESVSAQFEVGWSNPHGAPTKSLQIVEMQLDRGRLFLDQMRRGTEVWDDDGVAIPNPYFFSRVSDPSSGRMAYQGYGYDSIAHFLDFTLANRTERDAALENDSLPWALSAARVEEVLDQVRSQLETQAHSNAPSRLC